MKTTQNKNPFKAGDKVVRFQGGSNAGKTYDDPFIVSRVGWTLFDEKDRGHDYRNCVLVTPKSEIINDYNIF